MLLGNVQNHTKLAFGNNIPTVMKELSILPEEDINPFISSLKTDTFDPQK